ncbi:MAG TPA: ABC transporter, partial [Dermacoccus sp.]|nr:ABC transporter [Dermacoccus sp.]
MTTPPAPHASPSRQIGWRRIAVPSTWAAVILAAVTALATTAASVIAGRLAEHTSARLVTLLAVTVLGGALVDTAGRFLWAGMVDRAAGQLRRDLVDAVLAQPLEALSEQAGGEILDRVDDDTHEISNLLRQQIWMVLRMTLAMVPMWIVAGITWWPAWVLFPLFAALTWVLMRSLLAPIAAGKVLEEAAWTEHAAIFEEGVAGRDDIRTSLGQPFVVARLAKLSARVHERFLAVVRLEVKLLLRTGLSLHLLLVLVVLAGVALASRTSMSVGDLVTMFLVTSTFVGMLARVAEQFPDMQAGLGAIVRLRALLAVPAEPEGGRALPEGPLDLDVRHLDFSYGTGTFALQDVDLHVPAGSTLALVGRTGSGKSTLASLVSRAVEPPPGSLFLGGVDVRDL